MASTGYQYLSGSVVAALVLLPVPTGATDAPSPLALLRGVEQARTVHESVKARLQIEYVQPLAAKTVECLVELDGSQCRFEVFPGMVRGQVVIRDGDVFHGFRRGEHEDLEVYDTRRAVGTRGDLAFDPRVLGLSDLMSCKETVKACLWYENHGSLETIGPEELHGVRVWRVRVIRGDFTADFWIEEPEFRVHRKTERWAGVNVEIDSEFDPADATTPYPQRVIARRTTRNSQYERVFTLNTIAPGATIPPERFAINSIDLPINTPVVDYRISRRIGYWNGEGLSSHPVQRGDRPETPSAPGAAASSTGPRLWLIGGNVALLGLLAVVWWRTRPSQRTRASAQPADEGGGA